MRIDAHEVAPGLWVGATPPEGTTLRGGPSGFYAVFLCAMEVQPNLHGVKVIRVPLDDSDPSPTEIRMARQASKLVHRYRRQGRRVLVACAQGINRSAWVAAMAMMRDGWTADQAVMRIRSLRKHPAFTPLFNRHFVAALQKLQNAPSFAGAAA